MNNLILIKLGGSLITDKNKVNVAHYEIISQLAEEIKEIIQKSKNTSIIMATGAGGFGHPLADKYKHDLNKGRPEIKDAVKKINQIVVDSLNKIGITSQSVEPSKISEYKNGKLVLLSDSYIIALLEKNIIPVLHADLINDQAMGISILSMDKFLIDLALDLKNKKFGIDKIIFCGTTNGVLDSNGNTVDKIDKKNIEEVNQYFFKNRQVDTSGGMKGKVRESLRLIDEEIPCYIINSKDTNNLTKVILTEENIGTKIGSF